MVALGARLHYSEIKHPYWRIDRLPDHAPINGFHHRHETTNPVSLLVLHPFEVIGFGALMIAFPLLYHMYLGGLIAYL
jgi:hypothetical protein